MITITLLSNYLNHHTLPLCESFLKRKDILFYFVSTAPVPTSRLELGYNNLNDEYDFVIKSYESKEQCIKAQKIIDESDLVIAGIIEKAILRKRI